MPINPSDEPKALAKEILQATYDYCQEGNSFLEAMPAVNSVFHIARASSAMRDRLFCRKLIMFLNQFGSWSDAERDKFKTRIMNEAEKEKISERLIYSIERIEEDKKTHYHSEILKLYGSDLISNVELFRALNAIERVVLSDLYYLKDIKDRKYVDECTAVELSGANLICEITGDEAPFWGKDSTSYKLSKTGEILLSISQK